MTGKSAGFAPLEYAAGIHANLAIRICNVGSVAHQTAGFGKVTGDKRCGHRIARRQVCKLYPPDGEIGVATDKKRLGPLARDRCKSRIDFAAGAGVEDLNLQPDGACRFGYLLKWPRRPGAAGWQDPAGAGVSQNLNI
jgi:hypothetical protein